VILAHLTTRLRILFPDYHRRIGIHQHSSQPPLHTTLGSSIHLCHDRSVHLRPSSPPLPLRRSMYPNRPNRIRRPPRPRSPHSYLLRIPLPHCHRYLHRYAYYCLLVQHQPRRAPEAVRGVSVADRIWQYRGYYCGICIFTEHGAEICAWKERLYRVFGVGYCELFYLLGGVSMRE